MYSDIKIYPVKNNKTVKANGEVTINNALKVRFTIMNGAKGLFVGLPGEYYTDKEGNKKWSSKVDFVNDEKGKTAQREFTKVILDAFNKGSSKSGDQGTSSVGSEDQSVEVPF